MDPNQSLIDSHLSAILYIPLFSELSVYDAGVEVKDEVSVQVLLPQ